MLEAVELLPLSFHSGMVLLLALLLRLLVCSRYISLHNVSMLKVYTDGMYVCSFFLFCLFVEVCYGTICPNSLWLELFCMSVFPCITYMIIFYRLMFTASILSSHH